ncbi:glycerol-3-phosphate acyltransferase PlsX [Neisseria sp. HSC-16F19]|nr:phosphate acyltransferase PlsX [Neisseria sp. HSC-16F19]MCP2040594.1 glycerol-3-phosphate acyltransferase PlsX [Neisseria sp. HSC-16F19]
MHNPTIAVDTMGGDFGLEVTLPGVAAFLQQKSDASVILTGDEAQIQAALRTHKVPAERVRIVHTTQVVGMDEAPQLAMKNKKDSSMRVAINQVKEGHAQAAVSAGNTGALMATARFVLKTLPGIDRPAIAKFMPSKDDHLVLVLDLGANVDCTSEQLLQFALLGSELFSALNPACREPKVGLLNIGTEDIKGTDTVKQTFALLQQSRLNFVGNVEGNALFGGEVDVIVTDGFTGNVMLKTIEGAVKFIGGLAKQEFKSSVLTKGAALLALPTLNKLKQRLDPRRFNGAIFLGLRGIVIKSHGGTDAEGFCYSLLEAYHEIRADSLAKLEVGVGRQLAALEGLDAAEDTAEGGQPD